MQFCFLRTKVNLRSPRVQPGSNFHIWVQNPLGVLTSNFQSYPINSSQVIPFLRSVLIFSRKKAINTRRSCLFRSQGVFFQVLIASDPTVGNRSKYNTRCILPQSINPPSFSSLHSSDGEKRLPEVRGGFLHVGQKTGSGVPRSLGF